MPGDGVGAAEAKLCGDFLRRWHGAVRLLPFLDEIKNLLLSAGQGFNSVCLDSMTLLPVVKLELFTYNDWIMADK